MSKEQNITVKIVKTIFPCGSQINWWSKCPFEMALNKNTHYATTDFAFYGISQKNIKDLTK